MAALRPSKLRARRLGSRAGICTLLASVAAACALAPASARSARAAATTPRCASSTLVVWLGDEGAGTAGSFYYKLEFFNLSHRTCTLLGYPGVSAISLGGRQVGSPAQRERAGTRRLVKLAPRTGAVAILHVTDPGVLPPASCRATVAAGLRVYPPGQTRAKIVPFPVPACAKRGSSNMAVRAIEPQ